MVEVRFEADGKVSCSRAKSGHPIAIAAAMEAIPKWTLKPLISNGVAKAGCGRVTIKCRLRDRGSSTELQSPVVMTCFDAQFTGKERGGETDLDYFGAWYFSGAHRRFTSPDAPLVDQRVEEPQSWNPL